MCHSVGVRRTSPFAVVTRFAARSTEKCSVSTTASSSAGVGSAQCGSEAGEELVHAEGFGDVVVSAGVEGGDLVSFCLADGEDDDRHGAPAAETADHFDAVDAWESEVEDDEIGVLCGCERQRRFAGGGEVDVVSARAEVGGECAEDLGFVVDGEDAGHSAARNRATIVRPPPGVSSASISPPIASRKPLATASPSPMPSL